MNSSKPTNTRRRLWPALVCGVVLAVLAWTVPGHLSSVAPALLVRAGEGTPTLVELGRAHLERGLPGPAALLLDGARLGSQHAAEASRAEIESFAKELAEFTNREPDLTTWGGADPFLEPLRRTSAGATPSSTSRPIVNFLVTASARDSLHGFLSNSRLAAVRETLALRELPRTGRFVPANRPGGQTLEALLLLAALLQQGEHLNPAFAREWREAGRQAASRGELGALEPLLIDLLALGRRLDWRQLTQISGTVETISMWNEMGKLARAGGEPFSIALAASLSEQSAEKVLRYRSAHPDTADADLRLALASGQGALHLLLNRGVPVNRQPAAPVPGAVAGLALLYPGTALALKLALFAAGAYLLGGGGLQALASAKPGTPAATASTSANGRAALIALAATVIFLAATEPFNRTSPAPPAAMLRLAVPVLGNVLDPSSINQVPPTLSINMNTLISIGFFALLQIAMYWICLTKIREIETAELPSLVKLRLMENEENLFDGGLYIGIGGTATALVLQVLGVIEPNLLAAYSSNLFGITCVALVKIRLVRPYKTKLILDAQEALMAQSGGARGR
jgi:hypothetical protein